MIFKNVKSGFLVALMSDPGADNLRKAIDIQSQYTEPGLNLFPHFFGPHLCAEASRSQFDLFPVNPVFSRCLGEIKRIGWRACYESRAEILHEVYLPLRIACGYRNYRSTDLMRPVMNSHSSGKHAIAVSVLNDTAASSSRHRQAPGHDLTPCVNVAASISGDNRFPRSA